MTEAQRQRLNGIIETLETVQAQAPTKTTYTMGRADHSISHSLLDIIRQLKAFASDAASEPEADTEPVGTGSGIIPTDIPAGTVAERVRK